MLDHVSTKPFKRFSTIPRQPKPTIIMVQHPEVLWAQRSSEFDSEKVHSVLNASTSRLTLSQERDLCHRELARYPGKNLRVQLDPFFYLFQGKSWRVRFFFLSSINPTLIFLLFSFFTSSPYHQSIQGHPGKRILIQPRLLC